MAEVPYLPVGAGTSEVQLEPSTRSFGPRLEVNTNPAMFGANVGEAMEHFGGDLSKAGDELFSTAIKIQDLNNDATARDLGTKAMNAMAVQQAAYLNTDQQTAVQQGPKYLADSQKAYTNAVNSAPNPVVKRLLGDQLALWMRQNAARVSEHMATEGKKYYNNSENNYRVAVAAQVPGNAFDERSFQSNIKAHSDSIERQDRNNGVLDQNQINMDIQKSNSPLYASRVTEIARTNSAEGRRLLDQYTKQGLLQGKELIAAQDFVERQQIDAGATQAVDRIVNGIPTNAGPEWFYNHKVTFELGSKATGQYESGNNYHSNPGIETKYGHPLGKYQVMSGLLNDYLDQAGLPHMSEKEFLNSPDIQDEVFRKVFIEKFQDMTGSYAGALNMWFTGKAHPDQSVHDALQTHPDQYRTGNIAIALKIARANKMAHDNMTIDEALAAAREAAAHDAPGDARVEDAYVSKVYQAYSIKRRNVADTDWDANQHLSEVVFKAGAQRPTNEAELVRAWPAAQQWLDAMSAPMRMKFDRSLANNAKGEYNMDQAAYDRFNQLRSDLMQGNEDPEKFQAALLVAPFGEKMDQAHQVALWNAQVKAKQGQYKLPMTAKAISELKPILGAAMPDKNSDPDGFNNFQLGLQDALILQQETTGKPATTQDIERIGRNLSAVASKGWLSPTYAFDAPIPDKFQRQFAASSVVKAQGLEEGTDAFNAAMKREYFRELAIQVRQKTATTSDINIPMGP